MPYNLTNLQDPIMVAGATVLSRLALFLPNLLGAILVFFIGWIVSGWTKSLVVKLLGWIQLHRAIEGTVINTFIKKAELKGKIEDVLGNIVKWVMVFIFFIAAINILGLSTVALVLNNILAYIPKVVSATLILLAGVLLAGVVESVIKGATGAIDVSTSRLLGKLSSWVVVIFSILAAVSELGIAAQFINTLIIGVVATLSLGLGLALGLGTKDLVAEMLGEWYREVKKDLKKK